MARRGLRGWGEGLGRYVGTEGGREGIEGEGSRLVLLVVVWETWLGSGVLVF